MLTRVVPDRHRPITRLVLAATIAAVGLIAVAGCGSSSKPAYCSDRTNLENSIKGITSAAKSGGTSGLQTQVTKVESAATALVDSAKGDFPTETSAIKTNVDQLKTAVQGFPSNPSASDLAPIALDASAVVTSVKNFSSATSSKCD
jgi:hypothetical protein